MAVENRAGGRVDSVVDVVGEATQHDVAHCE